MFLLLLAVAAAVAGSLVDINAADAATLETLPGVGESTAAKIIAYRESNGPFTTVDQLDAVSGIGEKTMEKLRPLVTVGEPGASPAAATRAAPASTAAPEAAAPSTAAPSTAAPGDSGASAAPGCPVNINTADAAGLDALPGVGAAKAADIIAYRDANGAFSSCDGLDAVTGFGTATIDKLRSCCVVK